MTRSLRSLAWMTIGIVFLGSCDKTIGPTKTNDATMTIDSSAMPTPSDDQLAAYKAKLSPESYRVLFEADTEPPYRNEYFDNHAAGTYVSAATGAPLFTSDDKYESGTGWPSFVKPIKPDAVILKTDPDGDRTEVIDASSGGHLGHLFDDGPADRGGKRFCMNSAAMKFIPKGQPMPATGPGAGK